MSGGFFGGGGGSGGGITNDAPVGAIPVTVDGDGNLGESPLRVVAGAVVLDGGEVRPELLFTNATNDDARIKVLKDAGDGTERGLSVEIETTTTGRGGDIVLQAGASPVNNGGNLNLYGGTANDAGTGGSASIIGGSSTNGIGGAVEIQGGSGDAGGGDLNLFAGNRTGGAGTHGSVKAFSADSNQGFEVNNDGVNISDKLKVAGNVGFYGTTPVARPTVPAVSTVQNVIDALIALGLVSQS